ncbi:MAG: glycosyltransferase [Gammaproteobacteria bacterium]|nr:glycosyltransferase [Gammaproteobacteria bacterium]
MIKAKVAILHYSAPPVIGGVEAVIKAHVDQFVQAGYPCTVIAGRGDGAALPKGSDFIRIPEIDSQHPDVIKINRDLEKGRVPEDYERFESHLAKILEPVAGEFDHLIVHNVFTKHFNLPLTGALYRLLDQGAIRQAISWGHDFTWTSPSSRSKVHPGYPWDMLRTMRDDTTYVVVSKERQRALASLYNCPLDQIDVVYNGVDPSQNLGISEAGSALIESLGLLESGMNILMPVRVTEAKNIEFALKVLRELKIKGKRPMLVVTGPPDPHSTTSMEYYQSLQRMRDELGVGDCMRFVFESGPEPDEPFYINERIVGDLLRVSDVMFMPSHREGFGMPVLEAGMAGVLVVSSVVPAAKELAEEEAVIISLDDDPCQVAERMVEKLEQSPISRLRRRVRQNYTWRAIFNSKIRPLVTDGGKV